MITKAEEKRRERLREKAALMAFQALLTQYKGSRPPIKAICKEAWEAGNLFLRTSFENSAGVRLDLYRYAMQELKGEQALRRIAELDGFQDDMINWLVNRYKDEPDMMALRVK